MKAVLASSSGVPSWSAVRPPLTQMAEEETAALLQKLSAVGWSLKAYPVDSSNADAVENKVVA